MVLGTELGLLVVMVDGLAVSQLWEGANDSNNVETVGAPLGFDDGDNDGEAEGFILGDELGLTVGKLEGDDVSPL